MMNNTTAYIDDEGTIRMRNYKRTKSYKNIQKSDRLVGKDADRCRKHKIRYVTR